MKRLHKSLMTISLERVDFEGIASHLQIMESMCGSNIFTCPNRRMVSAVAYTKLVSKITGLNVEKGGDRHFLDFRLKDFYTHTAISNDDHKFLEIHNILLEVGTTPKFMFCVNEYTTNEFGEPSCPIFSLYDETSLVLARQWRKYYPIILNQQQIFYVERI